MIRLSLLLPVAALCACGTGVTETLPPLDRFYFPAGIAHHAAGAGAGTLYVASSNFDKRFDFGAVTAVDLAEIGLPVPSYLGGPDGPEYPDGREILDLRIGEEQRVLTAPFLGQMGAFVRPEGGVRLFVPSRAELDQLYVVNADGANLACATGSSGNDCTDTAPSLTRPALEAPEEGEGGFAADKPRAPEPYSVTIDQDRARVIVTHLEQADSPNASGRNQEAYVVSVSATDPNITADSFIPIGPTPASSAAIGSRYTYLTGRFATGSAPALRLLDLSAEAARAPLVANIQQDFGYFEHRDVVLSEDERRIFLLVRSPDAIVVLDVNDSAGDFPSLSLVGSTALPESPNLLARISRGPGRTPLLAVTCTEANAVVLYDDDLAAAADESGGVVALISGVGLQPFAIAVHRPPDDAADANGARLFVSNFADGQVTVIDIRDVNQPQDARAIARLGPSQVCLTDPGTEVCP